MVSCLRHHGGDVGQTGGRLILGAIRRVGIGPQHTDDAAHLGEGFASGLGDRVQDFGSCLRMLASQRLAAVGLHDDDPQRVGDHIVQLACDLVAHPGLRRSRLLVASGQFRPVAFPRCLLVIVAGDGCLAVAASQQVGDHHPSQTQRHQRCNPRQQLGVVQLGGADAGPAQWPDDGAEPAGDHNQP